MTPGQIQQSKLPTRIPMDGATFRIWEDGRITIGSDTLFTWAPMVFFGLVLTGLFLSVLGSLREGHWEDVATGLPWLCGIAAIFIFLTTLSRRASIEINLGSKAISIRRRAESRHIPFSSVAHIAITDKSTSRTQLFEIAAVLHPDERILMGSVSGFKGDRTHDRARTIATIIAQATHAPIADPTQSTVPLSRDFVVSEIPLPTVANQENDQRSLATRRFLWFGIAVLVFLLLILGFVVLILLPTL